MINWFDMPAEGLSNGGLFEVKELEVTENGTYETSGEMYNKVTVNVEGGGGSSDLSTAEVTIPTDSENNYIYLPILTNDGAEIAEVWEAGTYIIPLYKGHYFIKDGTSLGGIDYDNVSGNIEIIRSGKDFYYDITGDCTIPIV